MIFTNLQKLDVLKMSHDNQLNSNCRQDKFKFRTPPWKETYRKRCLERLRESRINHFSTRRHIEMLSKSDIIASNSTASISKAISIEAIMKEEWEKLQSKSHSQLEDDLKEEHSDDMFAFYETIHSEIRKELEADLYKQEQHFLSLQEICDKHLKDEEDLCLALANLSTDDVICPLCEKNTLLEHTGVIVCKCGLRINTEQDCISLRNVKANLAAGTSEHSEICDVRPTFHFSHNFGISNLLMTCESCDFLFIIV